jgi:ABC-type transporter Mla subunit MlaD
LSQNLKLEIDFLKNKIEDLEKSKDILFDKTKDLSQTQENSDNQLKEFLKNSSNLANSFYMNSQELGSKQGSAQSNEENK